MGKNYLIYVLMIEKYVGGFGSRNMGVDVITNVIDQM